MSLFGLGKRGEQLAKGLVDLIDKPVSAKEYIQQGTNPDFLIKQGLLAPEQINNIRSVQGAQNRYLKHSIQSPEFMMREMGFQNNPTVTSQVPRPPRNIIMPEDLEGMVLKSHLGDKTVTDKTILSIGGVDLPVPVQSRGGVGYGSSPLTPEPNYWGSNLGAATSLQNAAEKLEEMFDKPVAGVYAAMGRDGNFFNQAFADALQQQVDAIDLPQEAIDHFDNSMRTLHGKKDWVGLRHPDARKQLLGTDGYPHKGAGNMRSAYVMQMDKAGYKNQGFPLVQPLMNELIEPELANVNLGDSGFIMGQIGKDFGLSPNANHPSYTTGIMGRTLGGTPVSLPSRIMYPDAYKILDKAISKAGENFTASQMVKALADRHDMYQIATPEWVDKASEWIRKNPKGTANALLVAVGTPIALGSSEETQAAIIPKLSQAARSVSKQEIERIKRGEALGYNMSPEARLYHASKQDINQFEAGYDDGLIFTTPDPEFANNWLGKGRFKERKGGTGAIEGIKAEKKRFRDEQNEIMKSMTEDQRDKYFHETVMPQQSQLIMDERLADNAIYPLVTKAKKPFSPEQDVDILEELYGKEYLDAPFGSGFPTYRDALKDGNYLLYENKQVVDFLKSKGYDSMFLKESAGAENPYTTLASFDAKDLKSPHAQFKDPNNPNILAGAGALGLMSLFAPEEAEAAGLVAAVPAIARKLLDDPNAPKKNTPQGWANYLKNNGAKPNEIEKYNLDLIDSKRPLDKEEVSQYLLDNEYQFGRSLYTEQPDQLDVDVMREQYKDYFDEKAEKYGATTADINNEIGGLLDEKRPNFRTDRSDGDITNYRNQVLTDPSGEQIDKYIGMNSQRSTQLSGELLELHNAIENDSFILDNVDGNLVKVPMEEMKARQTQKQIEKARLEQLRNQAENRLFVESSHFTEPNAIGHVRTTDRVNTFDPRTGKKTQYRLMEEVQSDWVQRAENPDYGVKDVEAMDNLYDAMYESKVNQYKDMANASPDQIEGIFNAYLAEQADISRRLDSMNRSDEGLALVPQPPVAKPHIPLVNQTIIDAVDDNMDGVGIVTGDTQLAAKEQFQFINDISWKTVKSDGDAAEILFDFSGITNRQGDVGTVHQQLSMDIEKDLKAFRTMMPKGAADQIIDDVKAAVARGDDSGVMSNFNTQVEGKKLRPYYNKTLRKHLEQIGKQYGVKVEKRINTEMYSIDDIDDGYYAVVRDGDVLEEFNDIDEAKQYLSKQQMGADDHFYLPFTDEMKADVKKNGLKMFSTIGLTPVAIDAMRSNVNAEDERMRVVYDDTDTQREENRAAIEDMLARDSKTRRREELGDTLTGLLDAPKTALNLAGDVITDTIGGAFQVLPELGVRAVESAVPSLKGTGLGDRFAEGFSSLYKSEPRNRKEEMIRNQVTSNLMGALTAAAPYAQEAYTSGGLLGAPSLQDIVQTAKSGYEQLPEGYVKENLLPAAGYTAAGILSVPYLFGRAPVKAATENMMPQGLLN
jgi:hypothetical protein